MAGTLGGGFGALEEAAVDDDRLAVAELEFVAGAGDACSGAVVMNSWAGHVVHRVISTLAIVCRTAYFHNFHGYLKALA